MRLMKLTKALMAGLVVATSAIGNVATASPVSVEVNMTGLLGDYLVHDWFTYYTDAMLTSPVNLGLDITRTDSLEFVLSGTVDFPILRNATTGLYTGEVNTFIGFGRPSPTDTIIQWGQYLSQGDYSGVQPWGMRWSYAIDNHNNFVLDLFYNWTDTGPYSWLGNGPAIPNGIGGGTLSFAPREPDGFQSDAIVKDGNVHVRSAILKINGEAPAVVTAVPEASTAFLLAGGALSFCLAYRRAKKSA